MMQALFPNSAEAPWSAAARHAAHTLNNVTGVLYAALDHLEEPLDVRSAERARRAIERACAGTVALSAALSLLGLVSEDTQASIARGPTLVDTVDMARIVDILGSVGGLATSGCGSDSLEFRMRMDRDTLQSLLVCAVARLKHSGGTELSLQWCSEAATAAAGGGPRVRFDVLARNAQSLVPGAAGLGGGQHPCALALAHAGAVLAPSGLVIDMEQPGAVSLTIEAVADTP